MLLNVALVLPTIETGTPSKDCSGSILILGTTPDCFHMRCMGMFQVQEGPVLSIVYSSRICSTSDVSVIEHLSPVFVPRCT